MNANPIDFLRHRFGNAGKDFALPASEAPRLAADMNSPLADIFVSGRCRRIHKWLHYFPIYEKYLAPWRVKSPRFLEIGVCGGGSLDMWREYFGPDATIFGVDVSPDCAGLADAPTQIRIGSQDDAAFMRGVATEMGGLDIVLDDGSHVGRHQRASFDILFPLLSEGGLYIIEDVHTSYWREHQGGYRRRGTAIEFGKQIVDDLHGWYHRHAGRTRARDQVGAIHFHDSIIVIEKQARSQPKHVVIQPRPA